MGEVSTVFCDQAKRDWIARFSDGIGSYGPNFAYRAVDMPRHWHLAVFRDQATVFGVGLIRRGNRITDLEFKLHVAAFRPVVPELAVDTVSNALKQYSDAITKDGVLTVARGRRLIQAISQLAPHMVPAVEELEAWVALTTITGPVGEQLSLEKEAVGTLFEVCGLDRSMLSTWIQPSGQVSFLDGLPQEYEALGGSDTRQELIAAEPVPLRSLEVPRHQVEEPTHNWVNEDQLIHFDQQRFSDWLGTDGGRVGWRRYTNRKGTQRISVYYANRSPVEASLGVDLLYYHENHGCYVLIQYKKMSKEKSTGEWGYRPDRNLLGELQRMKQIDELCHAEEKERNIAEFRLLPTPTFVKLCEAQSLVVDSSEWIKGMYLPRELFADLLQAPQAKGPRGGVRLTYSNVERHLNATTFTTLIRDGWIGSRGAGTQHVKTIVNQTLETGRAVMVGVHSTDRPLGNSKRRSARR